MIAVLLAASTAMASEAPMPPEPVSLVERYDLSPQAPLPAEPDLSARLSGEPAAFRGRPLLIASGLVSGLVFGGGAVAAGATLMGRVDGLDLVFGMGLVALPVAAVGAGLLLYPSFALRADAGHRPVLSTLSAGLALVGLSSLAVVLRYSFAEPSEQANTPPELIAGAAGVAVISPMVVAGLGLMEVGLITWKVRGGRLPEGLRASVLPMRGGGQGALSLRF